MGGINQIGKEVVMFNFCLRWIHHVISKLLVAKIFHQWIQYDHKKHMVFYCCRRFGL